MGFGIDAKVVLGGTNVSATNSSPIWLLDSVIGYEGQTRLVAIHRLTSCSHHSVLLLRLIVGILILKMLRVVRLYMAGLFGIPRWVLLL